MISPYALLTASRPKSAASIVTPYDLYSVVQNREDMPSPPPDSPLLPRLCAFKARAPITSATSVSVITTPSAARHSARLPLCDLPYAFSIYRAGHTGRRRPSALRRFRLLSLFFRFLFRKIQILRGLLFFRTAAVAFRFSNAFRAAVPVSSTIFPSAVTYAPISRPPSFGLSVS